MSILKTKFLKLGVFTAVFAMVAFLFARGVLAVGVSPSDFNNDALMAGSHYENEFLISRAEAESAADVTIELNVEGINDWFTVTPSDAFTMAEGEESTRFTVAVDVPDDAEDGNYTGTITVRVADQDQEGQVVLVPGVAIKVDLTVSDQEVKSMTVMKASISVFEVGQKLVLELEIRNDGNVSIAPTKVMLDVSSINDEFLKSLETTDVEGEVDSFTTSTVKVMFDDPELEIGQYFGDVDVYMDDEVVYEDRVVFEVVAATPAPAQPAAKEEEEADRTMLYVGGGVLLVVVLIVGLAVYVNKKKGSAGGGKTEVPTSIGPSQPQGMPEGGNQMQGGGDQTNQTV
ncbi:hypothetical protein JW766_00010 [Candidatus Dojkabacteria bacterium]|nr:hypothetical protein [Candidatus Dojkabacteria bacterium]